jgi:hypothetical protein
VIPYGSIIGKEGGVSEEDGPYQNKIFAFLISRPPVGIRQAALK